MGCWFNVFSEFERKRIGTNNLILGFRYIPDESDGLDKDIDKMLGVGSKEDDTPLSVRLSIKQNVIIPTATIEGEDEALGLVKRINENFTLREKFGVSANVRRTKSKKEFYVVEITTPLNEEAISEIGKICGNKVELQKGDYDKMYRFRNFPDRMARFSRSLEERLISGGGIAELDSLDEIEFMESPSEVDFRKMPYVIFDIEKPLWKKKHEKNWIERREKLLKYDKGRNKKRFLKLPEDERKERLERRDGLVKRLEERLTYEVPGVGVVKLWEEKYDAQISFITACFGKDDGTKEREVYVIDKEGLLKKNGIETNDGCEVRAFSNEEELLLAFREKFREVRPVITYGHNVPYDITQVRFAFDEGGDIFDPLIEDVTPKRDFVQKFFQRLRQDGIYLDTMRLSDNIRPYLKQRRFGTSLKLEAVAQNRGIDFKKPMTHDQLREFQLKIISGEILEIREDAMKRMLEYSTGDLSATEELIRRIPFWPTLLAVKKVCPFLNLTRIAFSPNATGEVLEYEHHRSAGNSRLYGFRKKQRLDDIEKFKEEFPKLKERMLGHVGLTKVRRGDYSNVTELYLPLEEWLSDLVFKIRGEFKGVYESLRYDSEQRLGFLQYLKPIVTEVLTEYRGIRRLEHERFREPRVKQNELGFVRGNLGSRVTTRSKPKRIIDEEYIEKMKRRFYARYQSHVDSVKRLIDEGYKLFADEIKSMGGKFLESRGDYAFVQFPSRNSNGVSENLRLFSAIPVRQLENYHVGAEVDEESPLQGRLF